MANTDVLFERVYILIIAAIFLGASAGFVLNFDGKLISWSGLLALLLAVVGVIHLGAGFSSPDRVKKLAHSSASGHWLVLPIGLLAKLISNMISKY